MPQASRFAQRPLGVAAAFRTLWVVLLTITGSSATAQPYRTLTPDGGDDAGSMGRRAALVLGNAAYEHATPLQNATNDAEDVASSLQRLGFTVVTGTDLSHEGMDRALADFSRAAEGADAVAFFYAGHGVEVDGENYLIPVDAQIRQQTQVKYRALALGEVLASLDASGAHLKLVVLDACRNDPFRGWRSAGGGGLAAASGPPGTVIAFATGPGSVASDNPDGRNGLFTEALLEEVEQPGLELGRLLRRVGQRVRSASGGEQEPWVQSSYTSEFFFVPGDPDAAPPEPEPQHTLEEIYGLGNRFHTAWAYDQTIGEEGAIEARRLYLMLYERVVEETWEDLPGEAREGLFHLAGMAADGDGGPVDSALAERIWARLGRVADHFGLSSMLALAERSAEGDGLPQDLDVALDYWQRVTSAEDPPDEVYPSYRACRRARAHLSLAVLSQESGRTLPGRGTAAGYWSSAQAEIARCNATDGILAGRPPAVVESVMARAWQRAEEGRCEDARRLFEATTWGSHRDEAETGAAYLLETGCGTEPSLREAAITYRRAAAAGNPVAQYRLGLLYEQGRGLPPNRSEACRYFREAVGQGHEEAGQRARSLGC